MPAKFYEFEGGLMTTNQVHELIPCFTKRAIRKHLARGHKTKEQILCYDNAVRKSNSGRKGRLAAPNFTIRKVAK